MVAQIWLDAKFDKKKLKSTFEQITSIPQSKIIVASFPKNGWMLDWKNIMRKEPALVVGFQVVSDERFPLFIEITIIDDKFMISAHSLIKQLCKLLNCQILQPYRGYLPGHVLIYKTDELIRHAYTDPDIYPKIKIIEYISLITEEDLVNLDWN